MTVTAYPLCWPFGWSRAAHRIQAPYSMTKTLTFARARDRLGAELERLRAKDAILSTNVPLRFDGQPRGDARHPDDPGVAIYFTLRGRPMVMARDAYYRVDQNLNSLAIAIEHLRGLERHGGATMMERAFSGFAALPEPGRRVSWREVMGFAPGELEAMPPALRLDEVESRYRRAAMERHPDRGGSDERMAELNQARDEALKELGGGQ